MWRRQPKIIRLRSLDEAVCFYMRHYQACCGPREYWSPAAELIDVQYLGLDPDHLPIIEFVFEDYGPPGAPEHKLGSQKEVRDYLLRRANRALPEGQLNAPFAT